ncbi:MAG: hypothetical protein GKR91_01265 [Pseudomonadales bacterium]|nr:hypothetical protein [Pseudomonadales bacterium]
MANLNPKYDPWICDDFKLVLAGLIEEQLMLCMPIVNFHEDKACLDKLGYKKIKIGPTDEESIDSDENPFAVLKALKK